MGDRTYASITIHKFNYERNKEEIEGMGYEDTEIEGDEVKIIDYEANYGHLEALEKLCQEQQIEYDKRWEAGGDYGAGEEHSRIVDGVYKVYDIYDDGEAVLTELKTILAETDPIKREELIKKKILELEPFKLEPLKASNAIDFIMKD